MLKIMLKRKKLPKFIHSNLGIIEPRPAATTSLYLVTLGLNSDL